MDDIWHSAVTSVLSSAVCIYVTPLHRAAWCVLTHFTAVFLNRRPAARYRALASVIRGRERFSWNL